MLSKDFISRAGYAALFDFEDTIRFTPHYVLERSMYLNQVREFMRHLPRERIYFFVLEEFLSNKESVTRNLAKFLSLKFDDFSEGALNTHSNKAAIPRSIALHAFKNRILRFFGNTHYRGKLPFSVRTIEKSSVFALFVDKLHNKVNSSKLRPVSKMSPSTRIFLNHYFQREVHTITLDIIYETEHLQVQEG